jgi:predicted secreted Zn-dependent protease
MMAGASRLFVHLSWLGAAVVLLAPPVPALADVRTTTRTSYYKVSGTTARALVRNLNSRPLHGDYGRAYANIKPTWTLDVTTRDAGASCRADEVDVRISFRLTLPQAASRLTGRTKSAWDGFVNFATRHEQWHERSYTDCARKFMRQAQRVTAPTCSGVRQEVRQLFEDAKRGCEVLQRNFDRQERGRLSGLALFRLAR